MLDQQLIVGSNYRIKLKGVFERHGVCTTSGLTCLHEGNGVFRLDQITTFRDIVLSGIKLYDNFFAPLGISKDEYQAYFSDKPDDEFEPEYTTKVLHDETTSQEVTLNGEGQTIIRNHTTVTGHEVFVETGRSIIKRHARDSVNYANYPIYKFVDVINANDAIYVPELTLNGFPEIEISEYKDLNLVLHLGYFDKPALLDPMLLALRERMATYGVRPSRIKLYSTGSKWLNPDEYEAIKAIRVPGEIKTIGEDANFSEYRGEHVILNGMMKEIVENVAEGLENEQIAFAGLKSGKKILDNELFLKRVLPGDTFEEGKVYLEKLVRITGSTTAESYGWRVMNDPGECQVGTEIMQFVQTAGYVYSITADPKAVLGKTYYKRSGTGTTSDPYTYTVHECDVGDVLPPCNPKALGWFERDWQIGEEDGEQTYSYHQTEDTTFIRDKAYFLRNVTEDTTGEEKITFILQTEPDHNDYVICERTGMTTTPGWMTEYIAVPGDYVMLGRDEARRDPHGLPYRRITETNLLESEITNPEDYYWIRTTVKVGENPSTVVWKTATEAELSDMTIPIYRRMVETYSLPAGAATSVVRYASAGRFNIDNIDTVGAIVGSGEYAYEDYASVKALELVGCILTYTDQYGQQKENTLNLMDVVEFASKTKTVTLSGALRNPTQAQERLWAKYVGRKFRYTTDLGVEGSPLPATIEVVIPESPTADLVGKTGEIVGTNGTISRSLYFVKDTSMKRNYYMQYTVLKHDYDILQDKFNQLEKHVIAMAEKTH